MKRRCNDKNNVSYSRYGKLGISYSDSWEKYDTFLSEMGERPIGYTLDRIDNTKSYSKDNCKWSSPKEQAMNRSLPSLRKDNKHGLKGVYFDSKQQKYFSQIQRKGVVLCLGTYVDFFEACCARKSAETRLDLS